jgi:DNA repair exonuclease SbcCD ATPase subunit
MGIFSSSEKPPEQIIKEEEGELASDVWNLIEQQKTDLEKLRQLEQNPDERDITRAERALKSLAVGIENDLETLKEESRQVESEEKKLDLDDSFRQAAEHNLELLESAIQRLVEDDNNLEEWLKRIEREEDPQQELEEMIEIESRLEEDLQHVEQLMREGGPNNRGWIDLQQFNP